MVICQTLVVVQTNDRCNGLNVLQIHRHCQAFRAGLSDVINLEWLRMFDHKELQVNFLIFNLLGHDSLWD